MDIEETASIPFDMNDRYTCVVVLQTGTEILGWVSKTADEARKECHKIVDEFKNTEMVKVAKVIRFHI